MNAIKYKLDIYDTAYFMINNKIASGEVVKISIKREANGSRLYTPIQWVKYGCLVKGREFIIDDKDAFTSIEELVENLKENA